MSMISYAQNLEDVMLGRVFSHIQEGFYIDIGAQHPTIDSVSRYFYDQGWRGVNVEPVLEYADLIRSERNGDIVIQAVASARSGIQPYYEIPGTGLSTLDKGIAEDHRKRGFDIKKTTVISVTLDEIFQLKSSGDIHWLKIDVEGQEKEVLLGWRESQCRPWIVLVESVRPLSRDESWKDWEPLLLSKGYIFAWFDGLNRFYLSEKHLDLKDHFVTPPNIFDDFVLSGLQNAPFGRALVGQIDEAKQALAVERDTANAQLEVVQQQLSAEAARLAEAERGQLMADLKIQISQQGLEAAENLVNLLKAQIDEERQHSRDIAQLNHEKFELARGQAEREEQTDRNIRESLFRFESSIREIEGLHNHLFEHINAHSISRENALQSEILQLKSAYDSSRDELVERDSLFIKRAIESSEKLEALLRESFDRQKELLQRYSALDLEKSELARRYADKEAHLLDRLSEAAMRLEAQWGAQGQQAREHAGEIQNYADRIAELQARAARLEAHKDEVIQSHTDLSEIHAATTADNLTLLAQLADKTLAIAASNATLSQNQLELAPQAMLFDRMQLASRSIDAKLGLFDHWRMRSHLAKARDRARNRDWIGAEREYGALLRLCPCLPKSWIQLGHVLKEQNALLGAIAAYRCALDLTPDDVEASLQLGHALLRAGFSSQGEKALHLARQLADDTAQSPPSSLTSMLYPLQLAAARRAARAKNWTRSAQIYRQLVAVRPNTPATWLQLGHALKHSAKLADAETAYIQAFRLDPSRHATRLELVALGKTPEQLIEIVASGGAREGGSPQVNLIGRPLLELARRAARRKDWNAAARLYGQLLRLAPNHSPTWVQHGHMLKEQSRYAEAEQSYLRAISINPSNLDAYLHLGHALWFQGRIREANQAYQRARNNDREAAHGKPAPDHEIARVEPDKTRGGELPGTDHSARVPGHTLGQTRYVFVDHTVACTTNTGVQRVVRGMAKAFVDAGQTVRFVKWDETANACVLINIEERTYLGHWNGPPLTACESELYPAKGAPTVSVSVSSGPDSWLLVPEVTHLTFQPQPVTRRIIEWAKRSGLKTGFIFYDAIPLLRPEFEAAAPVHAQYMRDLQMADAIWPISRWSADEISSFWGADQDRDNTYLPKIQPIHLPAEFDRPRVTEVQRGKKVILSVGTLEPRKNQISLIRAFQAILSERPSCGWRLVLVGNLHPLVAEEVRLATGPGSAIEFLGHVPDADLSDLYERCAFTVFPSVAEGFGLPILESLWHAKPCLCANFGAMGEVGSGGGCLKVDVRDQALLKSALERLIDSDDLVRSLSEAAVARPMTRWLDYMADIEAHLTGRNQLIYYWVDSTILFPGNTGIQRVARQLARALIESGFRLVPVKWGGIERPFHPVSKAELAHFGQWNGPGVDQWCDWVELSANRAGGWFLMTELPLNLSDAEQKVVRNAAHAARLQTGAVFYDTIPWKLREIYPEPFYLAHKAYMRHLVDYSVVLPISEYSKDELISVLTHDFSLSSSQLGGIVACPLAGEFPEPSTPNTIKRRRSNAEIQILCVGTVEPRKNHERAIDAFELACERSAKPLRLTIVGGGHSIEPDLAVRVRARVAKNPRIVWEEKAGDARVNQLYDACDFTVYPSVEEGFGLPILESLWRLKPCICADFGAMLEVAAEGGGCLTVDVRNTFALADAIVDLANSPDRRRRLTKQAKARKYKSWRDYAGDVAGELGLWSYPKADVIQAHREAMGLAERPRLSVCISTYNRAEWLSAGLSNIARLYPQPIDGVEFVVCDNASTDHTPDVVKPYLLRSDFSYKRNLANVGMLGNLNDTAQAASGDYIWIVGDDDLLHPGAIERVLKTIEANPSVALVYLNYAHTRIDDARTIVDLDKFFAEATPIVPPEGDLVGPIREICARNENFFTAIYALVFRRDHALAAYSQNTDGRPFSTMLTCIPTTYYVLNYMMEEPGVWIGDPQVVVNMNVSWMRYAPLWILERIPEVYETARAKGVTADNIDRWRRHTLPGVAHFFADIFANDPLDNAAYFSPARLVRRFSDLPEFEIHRANLIDIYERAHKSGHPAASEPPEAVFEAVPPLTSGGDIK